tara:strand:- start:89392 stop:89547 length:156 start_codon:yes stop_codon:yes gene_type:complete
LLGFQAIVLVIDWDLEGDISIGSIFLHARVGTSHIKSLKLIELRLPGERLA